MYENHIVSRISWEFIIYCFPISFAHNLQAVATWYLKRWTGLPKCANTSMLYRKRENRGFRLKLLTTHLKCVQLVKYHILKYSVDEDTQFIYNHTAQRQGGKKQWNGVKELHERERRLFINELCRGQIGRQGLGFIRGQKCIDQMTKREHRSSVSSLTKDIPEEHLLVSLYGMVKQCRFLEWETAMQDGH